MNEERELASEVETAPAFGNADLSNCEREQIHLAGSIQAHGALLVLSDPGHVVVQASGNARSFLNQSRDVIGRRLADLGGNIAARAKAHLGPTLQTLPVSFQCEIGRPEKSCDVLMHRLPEGNLIVEFERAGPVVDGAAQLDAALKCILEAASLRKLCDEAARLFKEVTGYDRVMVYRFDDDGHGEVFAERCKPKLEPFLGNWYPASDIPQIARRLYERNRVRIVADVEFKPIPLKPAICPATGRQLDMSLCFLRSTSPIHIQYLKNMGVGATLVISLMVGGRLWGLVSCHHYAPRVVPFAVRAICELLAEAVATRVLALENFARAQSELSIRRLEQRMMEAIGREGDWRAALFDSSNVLLEPLRATGAALLFEGQVHTVGDVPATQPLRDIGEWLSTKCGHSIFASKSLATDEPRFSELTPLASGMIAVPISSTRDEFLIWFRPERIRTVTWGGDPTKPMIIGNDPFDLSPRRSFAQWTQVVDGTSEPWTAADLSAARLVGDAVADVIFQFRSVRMLIARSQLDHVSRQVSLAEQPVLIADADGMVLLANEALRALLGKGAGSLLAMSDFADFCQDKAEVKSRLKDLVRLGLTWRGEARLSTDAPGSLPLMVRGDKIYSRPGAVLGYVLLFSDLTARKAADEARQRFQDGIVAQHRQLSAPVNSQAGLTHRNLLAHVLQNAQLAALEITDGLDIASMPAMLESVKTSVERTAEVLKQLTVKKTNSDGSET
jgi:two-component system, chemotaxis family, sensor kinase Cph1